ERLAARMSGGREPEYVQALAELIDFAERQGLGSNSREIVRSAQRRGIPWFPFRHAQAYAAVQFGWGNRFRRVSGSRGPFTSYLGCRLSHSKYATASALSRLSLPVPRQQVVSTRERAVQAAHEIGYPVVVKPLNGSGGRGVTVGLENGEEV